MKFTLIVEDSIVGIDGVFRHVDLPDLGMVRAVQFNGVKGHIEYTDYSNAPIKNLNQFQHIIPLWESAAPQEPEEEPTNAVPSVVTMRQARLALLHHGLLANVETAIATLPSPQREAAEIEWNHSQEVQRDKPLVTILGSMLGLNSTQLDNLFTFAKTL